MRILGISLAILMMITLSACDHHGVSVKGDGYRVDIDGDHHHRYEGGGPRHCPPGHAKKGWC